MSVSSRLRRALGATLVATIATTLALPAPSAVAHPRRPVPTDRAVAAGVTPGNADMGWRATAVSGPVNRVTTHATSGVQGIDVSSHQGYVNWQYWWGKGKRFAYIKATEGLSYRNPYFSSQYLGSYSVGMIRGAYHFARPSSSSGATQADYFARSGGAWSRDGRTLPGVLDIEYNPYGRTCYGLSQTQMVAWIKSFTTRYLYRTGRSAVIYTTYDWWSRCTGNSAAFNKTNRMWVARYASTVGSIPGGRPSHTFWQYTSSPLDQNRFNGS